MSETKYLCPCCIVQVTPKAGHYRSHVPSPPGENPGDSVRILTTWHLLDSVPLRPLHLRASGTWRGLEAGGSGPETCACPQALVPSVRLERGPQGSDGSWLRGGRHHLRGVPAASWPPLCQPPHLSPAQKEPPACEATPGLQGPSPRRQPVTPILICLTLINMQKYIYVFFLFWSTLPFSFYII